MNSQSSNQNSEISVLENDIHKHTYLINNLLKKKKVLIHMMFCTSILLIFSIMSKFVFFIIILLFFLFFEIRYFNKTNGKIAVYNAIKRFLQFNLKRERIGDQSLPPFLQ